jgi:D-alanyl-D-alanine carboxypeptidase
MKKYGLIIALVVVLIPVCGFAATVVPAPALSAKGVAVYGWNEGDTEPTPLYLKNEHRLYPIASLTKLVTAKVAEELYDKDTLFTISKKAVATYGVTNGIQVGAQFTRDDLLKALLVNSSNDAATALMERVGTKTFLEKMNTVLHTNKYTMTSFVNPSGLDPIQKNIKPNRMTPYHLTRLLNDIYQSDPLLAELMSKDVVEITNLKTNTTSLLKQTNILYRDEAYKDKIVMSKTGLTNLAGQNVAFISPGNDEYEYISVVILGSKSRAADSRKLIDWINSSQTLGG